MCAQAHGRPYCQLDESCELSQHANHRSRGRHGAVSDLLEFFHRARLSDKEWIRIRPGRIKSVGYAAARAAYRLLPGSSATPPSLWGFLVGLTRFVLVALISFSPVIFAKMIAPKFGLTVESDASPATNPYYQATLLLVLQLAKIGVDRLNSTRKEAEERLRNFRSSR